MKYTIKPLEWGFKRARAINVFYEIVTRNKGEQLVIRAGAGGLIQSKTCHRDVKSAQSAAEADWQERIKEALEPVPSGWISVEDRLPPNNCPVLILHNGTTRIGELRWERPSFEEQFKAFQYWDDPENDGQTWEWHDVTHWQPMPAPPKEEQES